MAASPMKARSFAASLILLPLSGLSEHRRACCSLDPVANDPNLTSPA